MAGGERIVNTAVERWGRIDGVVAVAGHPAGADAVQHVRGRVGRRDRHPPEGPLHRVPPRRRHHAQAGVGVAHRVHLGRLRRAAWPRPTTRRPRAGSCRWCAPPPSACTATACGPTPSPPSPGRGCRPTCPSELAEMGDPEDVAPMVVYLLSDAAKDVTGQVYTAVGGRIAVWNQPVEVREMTTEGRWTPQQIAGRFDEVGPGADGADRPARADPPGGRVGREAQRLRRAPEETAVRFSYAESMTDPSFYAAAGPGGRGGRATTRSSCPTASPTRAQSDTTYPFNPDGTREFLEDKPFIEPFCLIPALGAVTTHAAVRHLRGQAPHPPPGAGGQAGGVGGRAHRQPARASGWGRARGPRTTSCSTCPGRAGASGWTSASPSSGGSSPAGTSSTTARCSTCPPSRCRPVPDRPVPILIGGHGEAALRRAADMGDGWMHGGGDPADAARAAGAAGAAAGRGRARATSPSRCT